ncbi:MAG: ABC transporter ATP-binding protein [Patescibacteria group bacterium]
MPVFRMLRDFFRPYRGRFFLATLLLLCNQSASFGIPLLIGRAVDGLAAGVRLPLLLFRLALILALGAARLVLGFVQITLYESSANRIVTDLRQALYEHLQELSFSYFDRTPTGDLMSRLTQDIEFVRNFFAFGVSHGVNILVVLLAATAVLYSLDWQLALVYSVILPPVALCVGRFGRAVRRGVVSRQEQAARLNVAAQENIAGVRVVRAFGAEGTEMAKFRRENDRMRLRNMEVSRLHAFYGPLFGFFNGLGTLCVLYFGGRQVIAREVTLGIFVSFHFYLGLLAWPIWALGPTINTWKQAEGAALRLAEILHAAPEIALAPSPLTPPAAACEIRFERVSFSYGEEPILSDVSFTARAGEKIALLGLTGSGKTTLVNLIPRFYAPTGGRILVDGADLSRLDLHAWRKSIGTVLQETFLFSTTIAANIAFGKPDATQDEIERAARAAQIHDFIAGLPKGYETLVGERGLGLSGGQKQRVALARALICDPRVLILDDATASVDTETEQAIQRALQAAVRGRTTFIIAQRLSTIRLADQILVLQGGRLLDSGNHACLYERNRFYRELYDLQLKRA